MRIQLRFKEYLDLELILDSKNISKKYNCRAFLAKTTDIPIIMGFSDLLDKGKLVIDYPNKTAYFIFKIGFHLSN